MIEIDVIKVAEIIGIPVEHWKGQCHLISSLMVEHKLVDGESVYGKYDGSIAPTSMFAGLPTSIRHGWIVTKSEIIDPTRWVFEDAKPYIFSSPLENKDYDQGSQAFNNWIRTVSRSTPPAYNPNSRQIATSDEVAIFSAHILGLDEKPTQLCIEQAMWIANTNYNAIGSKMAIKFYDWLVNNNMGALIPIDFKQMAEKDKNYE